MASRARGETANEGRSAAIPSAGFVPHRGGYVRSVVDAMSVRVTLWLCRYDRQLLDGSSTTTFDEDGFKNESTRGLLLSRGITRSACTEYARRAPRRPHRAHARATRSYFFALQMQRTAAAAARIKATANTSLLTLAGAAFSDPAEFRRNSDKWSDEEKTDEATEQFRLEAIQSVRAGHVHVGDRSAAQLFPLESEDRWSTGACDLSIRLDASVLPDWLCHVGPSFLDA